MSRKLRLKTLLMLAFLPVVLLPALLTGLSVQWLYVSDTQTVQKAIQEDLELSGQTRLQLINGLLSNARELAQTMALVWPDLKGDPNVQLQRLIDRSQIFTRLWVVDATGRVRHSSDSRAIGRSISSEEYWQRYRRRGSLTFTGLLADAQGRRVIRILAPLEGGDTLVASYDIDQIQRAFRHLEAREQQRFMILTDGAGNVIAHSDELALRAWPNLRDLPPVAQALKGDSGSMHYEDPETRSRRSASYFLVPSTGWALVSVQPSAESFLMPAPSTHRITLLTLLSSALLAVIATMLLSRRLATPIERFSTRLECLTQQTASPECLQEVPRSSVVEYDRVLESFKRLYATLARSITELEATNHENRLANQQLASTVENFQRLDAMRAEFINILSHDLRIPLTAIIGYTELLEDSPDIPSDEKRYVSQILVGCTRMRDQLDKLLDYARLEVGRFKLSLEPVDLRTAVPETLAFFQPIAARKEQTLEWHLAERLPELRMDPDRLQQILNNLVSNALKYTPRGGRVTVRIDAKDDHVVIAVSDTGIGLTAEDRAHLFEKFFRSARPEVQMAEGAGIGLALVKGVVEAHGGRIEAEGEPGKGSTFRVILPVQPADTPPSSGEPA